MRPALYYPWIYLKGGAERLILELVRRSRHDWTVYTNHYQPRATFPEFAQLPIVPLREISVRRSLGSVGRSVATLLSQPVDLSRHDALVIVSEGLGNFFAPRANVPRSSICLTPLKVAYDPVTRDRFFRGARRLHYRAAFAVYKELERPMWRRYERVLCISEEVRQRIAAARLVDPDRLEVARPGVDLDAFQPTGEREPFFLVPGRIMWQKNVELAIAAWLQFKPNESDSDFKLVIAGMVDAKSRKYLERLRQASAGRTDIRFVCSPSDETLARLYQRCHAVVFTAGNEDWGFVPLEAMASGKPVIATDRGGPRESVIDGETGFLRPDDPAAFTEAIALLARMPSPVLEGFAVRARAQAERFGWQAFVARVDELVLALSHKDAYAGAREVVSVSDAVR
jgi:glycosyltransferase involved in cell wall biosynthesis